MVLLKLPATGRVQLGPASFASSIPPPKDPTNTPGGSTCLLPNHTTSSLFSSSPQPVFYTPRISHRPLTTSCCKLSTYLRQVRASDFTHAIMVLSSAHRPLRNGGGRRHEAAPRPTSAVRSCQFLGIAFPRIQLPSLPDKSHLDGLSPLHAFVHSANQISAAMTSNSNSTSSQVQCLTPYLQ
ncbi:hypothetical protein CCHR01_02477 [Colletotrichum chrysophilum]|uniref:Uncharacterized protein n=1 Tax=Colletotrichum chrysophilum TaxID=1836956 RepID=A0AAD9EKB2_9PEZI|nr:hypothetical protein CCHR01_02477 [Colletotrichum chrysophilum]